MTANDMKFSFQLKFDSLFEFSAPAYDDRHISYLLTEAQFRVFLSRYNPLANKYQKGFEQDEQRRRDLEQLIKSAKISGTGITGGITYVATGSSASKDITVVSTIGLVPGTNVTGANIAANTKIKSIKSSTVVELDKLPTGNVTSITSGLGKSQYQGDVHPNGIFIDLPGGFLYAIEEGAKLNILDKESWVKPVKHDEYLANINNPYKKPYTNLIWRMDISREDYATGSQAASNKRTELILPSDTTLEYYRVRYLSVPPAIVCDELTPANQIHCILDESLHREIVDEAVAMARASVKPEEYQIGLAEKGRSE